MPLPIKASQYVVHWEWFARALSVWMLIEELWDILADADNDRVTRAVRMCGRVCVSVKWGREKVSEEIVIELSQ